MTTKVKKKALLVKEAANKRTNPQTKNTDSRGVGHFMNGNLNRHKAKQAGAELGQAQPQLGLRLANVEI